MLYNSKYSFSFLNIGISINFFPNNLWKTLLGADTDISYIWQDMEKLVIAIIHLMGKILL